MKTYKKGQLVIHETVLCEYISEITKVIGDGSYRIQTQFEIISDTELLKHSSAGTITGDNISSKFKKKHMKVYAQYFI